MKKEFKITDAQIADGCNEAYVKIGHNAYFGNGFNAGVEFALKLVNGVQASDEQALPIQNVVCSALSDEVAAKMLAHCPYEKSGWCTTELGCRFKLENCDANGHGS